MLFRLLIILMIVLVAVATYNTLKPADGQADSALLNGLGLIHSWFGGGDESSADRPAPTPATDAPAQDEQSGQETVVYKWQDASGAWQYSNTAPPEAIARSITVYRSDDPAIPATEPAPPAATSPPQRQP